MTDFNIPLRISNELLTVDEFWRSLYLYHSQPHLINRRIACCQLDHLFIVEAKWKDANLKEIFSTPFSLDDLDNIEEKYGVRLREVSPDVMTDSKQGVFISIQAMLGRNNSKMEQIVILDKTKNKGVFLAASDNSIGLMPRFSYQIDLSDEGYLRIMTDDHDHPEDSSSDWLREKLMPTLIKWRRPPDSSAQANQQRFQNLVPLNSYMRHYWYMKTKYSAVLTANWTECTNPSKYIFEDIAIAAYLIMIWGDRKESINFVDCGCGNGLLVYLLNQEGYKGFGVDIRRRGIWAYFEKHGTVFEIGAVGPDSTFPSCNWIIGNHADELTPWVPVIALHSSPTTNFFLLPCCAYEFDGSAYQRTNTAVSEYRDYMQYIKKVCEQCGFVTKLDRLRIPSTKRICLVGYNQERNVFSEEIQTFIRNRGGHAFQPRPAVDPVRNCTQLPRDLICKIVKKVVSILLSRKDCIRGWNKGTSFSIAHLAEQLTNDLKMLKSQCGGLQTLLRNHRYLFEIEKGMVSLRLPPTIKQTDKYKSKRCWYFLHHPEGCLYPKELCGFAHI